MAGNLMPAELAHSAWKSQVPVPRHISCIQGPMFDLDQRVRLLPSANCQCIGAL
jgi:hypothetical protein